MLIRSRIQSRGRGRRFKVACAAVGVAVAAAVAAVAAVADTVAADVQLANAATPTEAAGEIFRDATVEAGIDFRHFSGMTGKFYFAEMNGAGAALFDMDNDGDLDAYLVQGAALEPGSREGVEPLSDRLYRNELTPNDPPGQAPRFSDVTARSGLSGEHYGMGVAAGDFDNDGWIDLFVANLKANQLLRNNGDGTFSDVTRQAGVGDASWSISAVFADFDRDGRLDLFVTNYVDFSLASHRVCPAPSGAPDYCGPQAFPFLSDRLYRNLGDGRFEDVSVAAGLGAVRAAGMGVVAGDFDLDGWVDFYVANDQMENHFWINQGDGTFRDQGLLSATAFNESGAPEASMGIAAGDFDNDGDEDLFLSHLRRETNTLYRNEGSGLFVDVTRAAGLGPPSWAYTSFGTGWLDFDNDGWLDLLTVSGGVRVLEDLARLGDPHPLRQTNQLFHSVGGDQGAVRFEEVSASAGSAFQRSEVSRGAAFGDLDNDGDLDVLIANNEGPARLLVNRVGQDRHWLGLRLLEAGGLRDALGAWACLARPGRADLCRSARAGGSYASSSDPRVLFGLGDSAEVGTVRVTWPSGNAEVFAVEGVDRYLTLREGTGRAAP